MRAMLTDDAALAERHQQFGGTIEVRHFDVRRSDAFGIVRVGANAGRQVNAVSKLGRGNVVRLVGDLCVEDLDDIELASYRQRLQHRLPHSGAQRVERVWGVHQTTLLPDTVDHLRDREDVRNPLSEIQPNQLAGRGADLFADDDADPQVTTQHRLSGLDTVVIGNAHHVQPCRFDPFSQLVERGTRISRRSSVDVTVKANPAGRSRWWGPNGNQQQGGE